MPEFSGTDRYRVRRCLGAGGMGVVYEVYDRKRDVLVALKTLRYTSANAIYLLKREFRSLQGLTHINLVRLGELAKEDDTWFFTMELVRGCDLLTHLRGTSQSPPQARPVNVAATEETRALPSVDGNNAIALQSPYAVSASSLSASRPLAEGSEQASRTRAHVTPAAGSAAFGALDSQAIRAAFAQLVRGLRVLHKIGKIHRDIKPSNVLVTPERRVVLLDFGLILDLDNLASGLLSRSEVAPVGTAAYMAPEQAYGLPPGPAADWYATGVVLYQVLTGQLPFNGSHLAVNLAKQQHVPRHPGEVAPDCPRDLADLCADMLRIDPDARPTGREITERLNANASSKSKAAFMETWSDAARPVPINDILALVGSAPSTDQTPPFVGREREHKALADAYVATFAGAAVTVLVHGESGIGKSALIRHFVAITAAKERELVLLTGRCYPRELVPYKALDGVIDALSHYLNRLPTEEAAALVPRYAALLPQVFPVLGRVSVIAEAPAPSYMQQPGPRIRQRAFAALRELLHRLVERRPVIITIDDLQWADADSMSLLADLLRPPDAPPLLLLASRRIQSTAATRVPLPGDVRHLYLGPLDTAPARTLAAWLLARNKSAAASASGSVPAAFTESAHIVEEARGHPLYIDELVRRTGGAKHTRDTPLRLDEAIWTRASRLPPDTLLVLRLLAIAGTPLSERLIRTATGLSAEAFDQALAGLRAAQMAQTHAGVTGDNAPSISVEPYHDRVREAVLQHLSARHKQALHAQLAKALQADDGDAHAPLLVRHCKAAGDLDAAAHWARRAADMASATLAFDRAADLYRAALRLAAHPPAQLYELRAAFADALDHAGRNAEAAAVCAQLADGADPVTRAMYQGRVAQHLLVSGRIEAGQTALRQVLAELGMQYPNSHRRAMLSIMWQRAKLAMRGLRWKPRTSAEIDVRDRARIELYRVGARGLLAMDSVRAADFVLRGLVYALKLGEPSWIAEFLLYEFSMRAGVNESARAQAQVLFDTATDIIEHIQDPHLAAVASLIEGFRLLYSGQFYAAREQLTAIEAEFETIPTARWELHVMHVTRVSMLNETGALREVERCLASYMADARRRGDRYTEHMMRALGHLVPLSRDQPESALRDLDECSLGPADQGAHLSHWLALEARVNIALYQRQVHDVEALQAQVETMSRSHLRYGQQVRITNEWMRCRLAVAAAHATGAVAPALRVVRKGARRLDREDLAYARMRANLLRADACVLSGDSAGAVEHLTASVALAESLQMPLWAAMARRRHGEILGPTQGRALIAQADATMCDCGVVNPARMANIAAFGPTLVAS